MDPNQWGLNLKKSFVALEKAINNDLKIKVGKQAVDLFTANFQKEGFQNGAIQKWREVKRRIDPRVTGARRTRPILTGDSGNLGRSLRYKIIGSEIIIYSDVPYAEAHNEGTTNAGRNHNVTIPQRQFIGDSLELKNIIEKEMDSFFNKL